MTSSNAELTQELLKELIDYDPLTGVFVWRERPLIMFNSKQGYGGWNARYANKEAGCFAKNKNGLVFKKVRIFSNNYLCHHIAYFYMTGNWFVI